jgi:hypothetical protein
MFAIGPAKQLFVVQKRKALIDSHCGDWYVATWICGYWVTTIYFYDRTRRVNDDAVAPTCVLKFLQTVSFRLGSVFCVKAACAKVILASTIPCVLLLSIHTN